MLLLLLNITSAEFDASLVPFGIPLHVPGYVPFVVPFHVPFRVPVYVRFRFPFRVLVTTVSNKKDNS